jgi:hypothetical protein
MIGFIGCLRPADGHIPAFRRHVTVCIRVRKMKKRRKYIKRKVERKGGGNERKKEGKECKEK